jgi:hypothetical protein
MLHVHEKEMTFAGQDNFGWNYSCIKYSTKKKRSIHLGNLRVVIVCMKIVCNGTVYLGNGAGTVCTGIVCMGIVQIVHMGPVCMRTVCIDVISVGTECVMIVCMRTVYMGILHRDHVHGDCVH